MQQELGPAGAAEPRTTSLRAGSAIRLLAELVGAPLAFGTGLITAKSLGPDGKGILATLGYAAALAAAASGMGLGEAGVTAAARRLRSLESALAATLGLLAVSGLVGMGAFAVAAWLAYGDQWRSLSTSIVAIAASVPLIAATTVLTLFLQARDRFVSSALARVSLSLVSAVATFVFVVILRKDLDGASAAFAVGWLASAAVTVAAVHRAGFSLRPTMELRYLRSVLPLGLPLAASSLLLVLAARADLLLVSAISGTVPAGHYSVALTVGTLVAYAPAIIVNSSFPRLAAVEHDAYRLQAARLTRMAVLVSALPAVVLALALPLAMPWLFGEGYRPATVPAALLLAGQVVWAAQWVLCRARASRGDGRLLLRSFSASVAAMLVADVALVSILGPSGAALGFLIGSAVGLAIACRSFVATERSSLRELLVPHGGDVGELRAALGEVAAPILALVTRRASVRK